MSAYNSSSSDKLARLPGTPKSPILVDDHSEAACATDPRLVPSLVLPALVLPALVLPALVLPALSRCATTRHSRVRSPRLQPRSSASFSILPFGSRSTRSFGRLCRCADLALLSIASVIAIFRFKAGLLQTLVASAVGRATLYTIGLIPRAAESDLGSFLEFSLYQRLEPKIRELSNGHLL
jgi:hypothetical protein